MRPTRAAPTETPRAASPAAQTLGLAVSELTEAQKREAKIKGGVKVDAATEAAQRAGIREAGMISTLEWDGKVDKRFVDDER